MGNSVTVARMFSKKAKIVVVSTVSEATATFFAPIFRYYVIDGMSIGIDLERMMPEERGQMIHARMGAANTFPSLPETQRKVAQLDGLGPPKEWAEAIDPDVPNPLWELINRKEFFKVCYKTALNIKSTAIAFLQQTGVTAGNLIYPRHCPS